MIAPDPAVAAAHAALGRGTDFLRSAHAARRNSRQPSAGVTGNALAELDRLLHVLIVEVARERGVALPARTRDTSKRFAALSRAGLSGAGADARRLQGLFRAVSHLRRGTAGGVALRAVSAPSSGRLLEICAFYDRLGREVTAHPRAGRPPRARAGLAPLPA